MKLGRGGGDEAAHAQPEEAKGLVRESLAAKDGTGHGVEVRRVFEGFFDTGLTGESAEVAVANFDLDGAGGEAFFGQFGGEFLAKPAKDGNQNASVGGVGSKGFFGADAFDGTIEVQGAIIIAEGIAFERGAERANQGPQIPGMVL